MAKVYGTLKFWISTNKRQNPNNNKKTEKRFFRMSINLSTKYALLSISVNHIYTFKYHTHFIRKQFNIFGMWEKKKWTNEKQLFIFIDETNESARNIAIVYILVSKKVIRNFKYKFFIHVFNGTLDVFLGIYVIMLWCKKKRSTIQQLAHKISLWTEIVYLFFCSRKNWFFPLCNIYIETLSKFQAFFWNAPSLFKENSNNLFWVCQFFFTTKNGIIYSL